MISSRTSAPGRRYTRRRPLPAVQEYSPLQRSSHRTSDFNVALHESPGPERSHRSRQLHSAVSRARLGGTDSLPSSLFHSWRMPVLSSTFTDPQKPIVKRQLWPETGHLSFPLRTSLAAICNSVSPICRRLIFCVFSPDILAPG